MFASIAYLKLVGGTIVLALSLAVTASYTNLYRDNLIEMRQLLLRLVPVGFGLGMLGVIVAVVGGRWLLVLVYDRQFAPYAHILMLVIVAATISYVNFFLKGAVTAIRAFSVHLPLSLMTTVFALGSAVAVVPRYGIEGAAIILILVTIVDFVGYGTTVYLPTMEAGPVQGFRLARGAPAGVECEAMTDSPTRRPAGSHGLPPVASASMGAGHRRRLEPPWSARLARSNARDRVRPGTLRRPAGTHGGKGSGRRSPRYSYPRGRPLCGQRWGRRRLRVSDR